MTLFGDKGRKVGEIDLLAHKDGHTDVFEVKCSPRKVKARKQLKRIKKHIGPENTRCFFYCGASKEIEHF
ncbi:MAG: hypothetical protein KKG59_02830 [Nanoarchaeota archaeon]|nr:hypothetical protein [Nanoarchaeota archaeon]